MSNDNIYRELIGNNHYDRSDLPDWIALVQEQISERSVKVERLQQEISRLAERNEPSDKQRAKLQTIEAEMSALQQRLTELEQQTNPATPSPPVVGPDLAIGGIAMVVQNGGPSIELRTRPGLQESGIIDRHQPGMQVTLLDGPEYEDGHIWWRVRRIDGREGWIASDGLEGRPA